MKPAKRTIFWVVFLLLATMGGRHWYERSQREAKPKLHFETARVDRGPIAAKVSASGTFSALVTVQVGSQVSGRLKEIFVDFNSPVKKRQVIAKIDPQLFQAALEQAQANHRVAQGELARAQTQAAEAERQLARLASLGGQKLVAQAEVDSAQANEAIAKAGVTAARGRLEQARAALSQARINLTFTTITSPIDGVVISRNVDVGQTVAASLQAPILFVLAEDLRKMQVNTSVAEGDIGKLADGMDATFTVDAYPSERFTGRVRQIRNAPQTLQNVVTYDAVIDVENGDLRLRPGMTANVSFVYAERPDVLRLPNAALRFRAPSELLAEHGESAPKEGVSGALPTTGKGGTVLSSTAKPSGTGAQEGAKGRSEPRARGRRTVWVFRDGKAVMLEVETGITDGTRTELAGTELEEGDLLITEVVGGSRSSSPSGGGLPSRRIF